jgi:hypothetical protein
VWFEFDFGNVGERKPLKIYWLDRL